MVILCKPGVSLGAHPHMTHDSVGILWQKQRYLVRWGRTFVNVQALSAVIGDAGGIGAAYHTAIRQVAQELAHLAWS